MAWWRIGVVLATVGLCALQFVVRPKLGFGITPPTKTMEIPRRNRTATQFRGFKRAFICVTGQLPRLVLTRQVETMFRPLVQAGYYLDFALILSDDGKAQFTNGKGERNVTSLFANFSSAVEFLRHQEPKSHWTVLTESPTPAIRDLASHNLTIHPSYAAQMDKPEVTDAAWRQRRVENHGRQFINLLECNKYFQKQDDIYNYYDFVMRIREDVAMKQPWNASKIESLELMLAEQDYEGSIYSVDCRCHSGMNDRLALVTPDAASIYFERPFEVIFGNEKISPKVVNPESFAYRIYEPYVNLIRTPILRFPAKYIVASNGTLMLAYMEEKEFCGPKTHCSKIGRETPPLLPGKKVEVEGLSGILKADI